VSRAGLSLRSEANGDDVGGLYSIMGLDPILGRTNGMLKLDDQNSQDH
jgi:hypothetical protein